MTTPCAIPAPTNIFRQNWGSDATISQEVTAGERFEAVEIGPDSEADEVYLFNDGLNIKSVSPSTFPDFRRDEFGEVIRVAVGCPYVGPLRGPWRIAPRYHEWSRETGSGSGVYSRIGTFAAKHQHRLQLRAWPVAPHWFARKRPDASYYEGVSMLGTVAETDLLNIPAYGREDLQLDLIGQSNELTAGTFTIRVYGENPVLGTSKLLDTVAATTLALATETFEYEGKFDHYRVTYQAAGVTNASGQSTFRALAKVRDK
jgi:hypothetical protein